MKRLGALFVKSNVLKFCCLKEQIPATVVGAAVVTSSVVAAAVVSPTDVPCNSKKCINI